MADKGSQTIKQKELLTDLYKRKGRAFVTTVGLSLVFVLVFGGVGYVIDTTLSSSPWIMMLLIGVGYIANQIFLAKYINKLTK